MATIQIAGRLCIFATHEFTEEDCEFGSGWRWDLLLISKDTRFVIVEYDELVCD